MRLVSPENFYIETTTLLYLYRAFLTGIIFLISVTEHYSVIPTTYCEPCKQYQLLLCKGVGLMRDDAQNKGGSSNSSLLRVLCIYGHKKTNWNLCIALVTQPKTHNVKCVPLTTI